MKILIGNNTLSFLGGSESWTFTLATALKKLGHQVECFSPELGIIAQELEKQDIASFADIAKTGVKPFSFILEEKREWEYDFIISSHYHITNYLRQQFPKTPIISVVHGPLHADPQTGEIWPEHPATEAGVNQFVTVSEEIREMLMVNYGIDAIVVRQFFDMETFTAKREISEPTPKMFFVNTNYFAKDDEMIQIVREVSKHYGAQLSAIGQNLNPNFNVMQAIEMADVVICQGRSVLEGVCAGRLGIVHGRFGTGGVICEENIDKLRAFNFSGRSSDGTFWTKEQFIEAIDRYYNKETIDWGKKYMRREHNAIAAAEEFLRIGKELLGNSINKGSDPVRIIPFRRQRDVAKSANHPGPVQS